MCDYLFHDYLPALLETLAIELGVAVLLGFWGLRQLGVAALVSLVTHPLLHVVLWMVFWWNEAALTLPLMSALEVVVFLAEGMMMRKWLELPTGRAFLMSASMNGASYLIGLAMLGP